MSESQKVSRQHEEAGAGAGAGAGAEAEAEAAVERRLIRVAGAAVTPRRSNSTFVPNNELLKAYDEALKDVRKSGRPVELTIRILPETEGSRPPYRMVKDIAASVRSRRKGRPLDQALADARGRGRIRAAEILAGEEMLSADLFARELGTTRATVNAWRKNRQVLALEGATRGFKYPAWQVDAEGKPFAAIPTLFERLGGSSWAVYRFLVQHHPELNGRTGIEELERGEAHRVIETAESVARAFA